MKQRVSCLRSEGRSIRERENQEIASLSILDVNFNETRHVTNMTSSSLQVVRSDSAGEPNAKATSVSQRRSAQKIRAASPSRRALRSSRVASKHGSLISTPSSRNCGVEETFKMRLMDTTDMSDMVLLYEFTISALPFKQLSLSPIMQEGFCQIF